MTRLLSRSAGLALLLSGVALCIAIVLFLILAQLLGPDTVIKGLQCHLGFSEECLVQKLRAERRELAKIRKETENMQEIFKKLEALDHASSSYVIFFEQDSGRNRISTGHRYVSLLDPNTIDSAWCNLYFPNLSSISQHVTIAKMSSKFRVRYESLSARTMRKAGLDQAELQAALTLCTWPEGAILP